MHLNPVSVSLVLMLLVLAEDVKMTHLYFANPLLCKKHIYKSMRQHFRKVYLTSTIITYLLLLEFVLVSGTACNHCIRGSSS